MDYPVWDVAMGGGVLMGVVAVAHVIVAHFAIGGGLLLAVSETLAVRRDDRELRLLAKRSSLLLVLVSTVFGAISGVGIWFVAGLISPGAISTLIHTYVWGWAIEWTFFLVEIVAALLYYTTWDRISPRAHLVLAWIYVVAAYLSLVVINGIITFMLTPGRWLATGQFWDGFFNPTYWPSLVLRTGVCVMLATAFMLFPMQRARPEARPRLARYLGWWLAAGTVLAYVGVRWWEAALPDGARAFFLGDQPLLAGLATTRSLMLWALAASLVLAMALLVALPRAARTPAAVVVMVATFVVLGSYERVREGARKPFLIHGHTFSNGLRVADIDRINARGLAAVTGWISARAGDDPATVRVGEELFRIQCRSCHTRDGYLSMREALPTVADMATVVADDPPGSGARAFASQCARCHPDATWEDYLEVLPAADEFEDQAEMLAELNRGMIAGHLDRLRSMGASWSSAVADGRFDVSEVEIPHMPPFVGSEDELEALVDFLDSIAREQTPPDAVVDEGGSS